MEVLNTIYKAGEHGIPTDRLFNILYGNDPNGGPELGLKALHVRISQINRKLREHGWEIQNKGGHEGAGVFGFYVLRKLTLPVEETARLVIEARNA